MRRISNEEFLILRDRLLEENILLSHVLEKVKTHKYIVGGYIRDYISYGKRGRDVDILVEVSRKELQLILDTERVVYTVNHFGGYKFTDAISIDIWSIDDNWAFRTGLVKASKKHMKRAISRGCFFNYDALVMDLSDGSYEIGPYESFVRTQNLDVLQDGLDYRINNPTALANVIRALWIKIQYNCSFSDRLESYLDYVLQDCGRNQAKYLFFLNEIETTYIKYSNSAEVWKTIVRYCNDKINGVDSDGQLQFLIPIKEQFHQETIEFEYL